MLLSIVVLSYNRPIQLSRLLSKFHGFHSLDIELIIKDDCSPLISEIRQVCNDFRAKTHLSFYLHENPRNLGYDLNLLDAFNISSGRFVFLLSDDDYIETYLLPNLLSLLSSTHLNVIFMPYWKDGVLERCEHFSYCINSIRIIYNSILFSGLVFVGISQSDRFRYALSRWMYDQVYIFFWSLHSRILVLIHLIFFISVVMVRTLWLKCKFIFRLSGR